MLRVVVLPDPEGPSNVMNSPGRTVRLTSSTAVKVPNVRVTDSMRSSTPGLGFSSTVGSLAE
jgi:hypothetical protein